MIVDGRQYLPLAEAAEATGLTRKALRRRREKGRWETIADPLRKGQWLYATDRVPAPVVDEDDEADESAEEWDALRELMRPRAAPAPVDLGSPTTQPERTYRVLSLWDVHVPEADAFAFRAVLDLARDEQPDHIVLGGDFLELESCSQHGGVASPKGLVDEIKAGRKALDRIRDACPSTKLTYLEGNHETRLSRVVVSNLPTFDGAFSVPELLRLDEYGCEWVPYRQLWRPTLPGGVKAKLYYTHGEWTNMHHAAKHLNSYGVSVRYGHTHKPQSYTRGYGDGRVCIAIGSPCLRTLDPDWVSPHHGWLQGFGWDEIMSDGTFTASNVVMAHQRFAWRGRVYGARR